MTSAADHALQSPFEGLLATPASRLPYQHDVLLRSYLLERSQGNIIVYNSPGVSASSAAILDRGRPQRLLINHEHESMYGQPAFDVPVWVHENDSAEVSTSMSVAGTFHERRMIDDDLEVIPTPGHTAGTTSFLWDDGRHRFLFTGDFIWIENGEWKAVVLDAGLRDDYVGSLELVRDLDFDVLVPWGVTEGGPVVGQVGGRSEIRERVGAIIGRVESGGTR